MNLIGSWVDHLYNISFFTYFLVWNLTLQANDNGNYFPLWGECLGFEAFHVLHTKKHVLSDRRGDDTADALNFTPEAKGEGIKDHSISALNLPITG